VKNLIVVVVVVEVYEEVVEEELDGNKPIVGNHYKNTF
jgi:hypothetical protein